MNFFIIALIALVLPAILPAQNNYAREREKMVDQQIAGRGIKDRTTLDAMRKVERHHFVPAGERSRAYWDGPVPIGYGQTISQPYIVGFMTELIAPKTNHRVLEIGTGSGYQAAVLAEIVDSVFSIEIVEELGRAVIRRFDRLGYDNIEVKIGDGYHGWPEHGPFDAIIVTAAAAFIPPPLIQQLKDGGKMIIPVGSPFSVQNLILVTKNGSEIKTKNMLPVRFVPFTRSN